MSWYHYLVILIAVGLIVTAYSIWKAPEVPPDELDEDAPPPDELS